MIILILAEHRPGRQCISQDRLPGGEAAEGEDGPEGSEELLQVFGLRLLGFMCMCVYTYIYIFFIHTMTLVGASEDTMTGPLRP